MTITNENKPKRLYIYTKDVMRITGKGRSASQNLIRRIKSKLSKKKNQSLTVVEFCQSEQLTIEQVNPYL